MTPTMKTEFQQMTKETRPLGEDASVATHQDLSALFVARAFSSTCVIVGASGS